MGWKLYDSGTIRSARIKIYSAIAACSHKLGLRKLEDIVIPHSFHWFQLPPQIDLLTSDGYRWKTYHPTTTPAKNCRSRFSFWQSSGSFLSRIYPRTSTNQKSQWLGAQSPWWSRRSIISRNRKNRWSHDSMVSPMPPGDRVTKVVVGYEEAQELLGFEIQYYPR